jgi:hypothetical protein
MNVDNTNIRLRLDCYVRKTDQNGMKKSSFTSRDI